MYIITCRCVYHCNVTNSSKLLRNNENVYCNKQQLFMESILSFDTRQELGVFQMVIITYTYNCNDLKVVLNISKL